MEIKSLLENRKIRKNKMRFVRTNLNIKPQFGKSWRKPRGPHNKMRLGIRGKSRSPSPGYGTNKLIKGLTREGLNPLVVNNIDDVNKADKSTGIIIGSKVGERKKLIILNKIKEKNLIILNVKNVESYVKSVSDNLAKRKEESKKKKVKKSEKKEIKKEDKKKEAKEEKDENRK